MSIQTGQPAMAWLALFGLVAFVLSIVGAWRRRQSLRRFADQQQLKKLAVGRPVAAGMTATILLTLSLLFLTLALMDLRWGKIKRETPQRGIEVVFALDVSRSMLAQDVAPNRLERAKQQIKDLVDEMLGDRVGLVVFAGDVEQAVPLTNHYDEFKRVLDTVGPETVARGGSQLGPALQAAADAFLDKTNGHKTIILFTDGEDQESRPVEIAKRLHEEGVARIFTVGLGDMVKGSRIPTPTSNGERFVEHQGEQVWSRLDGRILREIATTTGAAYIPAGAKRVNMRDVYDRYIAHVKKSEFETITVDDYAARFQWFAGLALGCLLAEVFFATWRPRRQTQVAAESTGIQPAQVNTADAETRREGRWAAASISFLLATTPATLLGQEAAPSAARQINAANQLLREQQTEKAIEAYNRVDVNSPLSSPLNYNLAVAHYRNGDYPAAKTMFAEAARSKDQRIAAQSRYNLGNCHYATALAAAEQQPEAAVGELNQAIQHYRSALRLDRSNAEARANIELARKLIEQLREQQEDKQQEQPDDQNNPSQEKEEGDDEGPNSDQNSSSESSESQSKQDQDPSQEGESEERKDQQDPQPQTDGNESQNGESQNEMDESNEGDAAGDMNESDDQQPKPEGDASEQSRSSEQQGDSPMDSQAQSSPDGQKDPAEEGGEATPQNESESPPEGELTADNAEPQQGQAGQETPPKKEGRWMTREEAMKMLQSVRDRELLRRLQQQQRRRSRRIQVERDW